MKAKSAVYTALFLLVSVLVVSCHKNAGVLCSTISRVEKCIDTYPDSALNLLKKIPHPEKLHGKLQADYALLMTQAMDKNYMKFDSDSLIAIALNYYTVDQRNPILLAKAQFYYGRVMLEFNRQEEALKYFLSAESIFDSTREYKMLGLISDEIGKINRVQEIYDNALVKFHNSLLLYQRAGDSLCVVRANQNIARTYLFMNKMDSSLFYYSKALKIAQKKKYDLEVSILHELGILYRSMENSQMAEHFFLAAFDKEADPEKRYMESLSLGYLYLQMDNIAEARKYLLQSTKALNLLTKTDAYRCLFELEKLLGNYQLAITYIEKSDSLNHIFNEQNSKSEIADLQKKYDNEKLRNENLQIRMKYVNAIAYGTIVLFVVVSLMCYFYYKNRNAKKRIAKIESKIQFNEAEIERYQYEIAQICDSKQQLVEENRVKVGELNGMVMILKMQNKAMAEELNQLGVEDNVQISKEYFMPIFRLLLALKEGTYKRKLTDVQREKIHKLFDFLHQNYASRLREKYPSLTKRDMEICCLLKFGMTNEELSIVFMTTTDSVTKAKGRLKVKLGLTSRDDLELFLLTF